MQFQTISTLDGSFTVLADANAVLASGWTDDVESLHALIHPKLQTYTGSPEMLAAATEAVRKYYDGDLAAPGLVPVQQTSGSFREHAWDVLRKVEPGEVITYTQYAERCGRPAAVRAAAGACAMNAAALFVPCHRVLRSDGTLGGFRYGLDIKNALLTRESLGNI